MLSCEYLVSVRLISVEECFMVKCVRDSVFSRVLAPSYRIRHRSHVGGDGQAEPHRCRSCRLLRLFGGGFGQKEEVHLVRFLEGALEPRPHFALPPARCKSVLESLRGALVFPLEMLEMFHLCVYGGRGGGGVSAEGWVGGRGAGGSFGASFLFPFFVSAGYSFCHFSTQMKLTQPFVHICTNPIYPFHVRSVV